MDEIYQKDILVRISSCMFPHLKNIGLSSNRIENIEALCFLNAPSLETMNLFDNCISTLKPFRKFVIFEQLFVFSIDLSISKHEF